MPCSTRRARCHRTCLEAVGRGFRLPPLNQTQSAIPSAVRRLWRLVRPLGVSYTTAPSCVARFAPHSSVARPAKAAAWIRSIQNSDGWGESCTSYRVNRYACPEPSQTAGAASTRRLGETSSAAARRNRIPPYTTTGCTWDEKLFTGTASRRLYLNTTCIATTFLASHHFAVESKDGAKSNKRGEPGMVNASSQL
jgi:hypothetical protein